MKPKYFHMLAVQAREPSAKDEADWLELELEHPPQRHDMIAYEAKSCICVCHNHDSRKANNNKKRVCLLQKAAVHCWGTQTGRLALPEVMSSQIKSQSSPAHSATSRCHAMTLGRPECGRAASVSSGDDLRGDP